MYVQMQPCKLIHKSGCENCLSHSLQAGLRRNILIKIAENEVNAGHQHFLLFQCCIRLTPNGISISYSNLHRFSFNMDWYKTLSSIT